MDITKKRFPTFGTLPAQLDNSKAPGKRASTAASEEATRDSQSPTEIPPQKRSRLNSSTSFTPAPANLENRTMASFFPVTALGQVVTKTAELKKLLQPEFKDIKPAVFVVDTSLDGARKSTYSSDLLKDTDKSFLDVFRALKEDSRLAFLFPDGSYKEVRLASLKEKDKSGYLASVLFGINAPFKSSSDFLLKKVLLSACLYLGWIEKSDEPLAKTNLLGINEKHLNMGVKETFFLALDIDNKELVDLMIDWGADVNARHSDDYITPLYMARIHERKDIEQSLLSAGAVEHS